MNFFTVDSFPLCPQLVKAAPRGDEESDVANSADAQFRRLPKHFGIRRIVPPGRPAAAQGYLWLTACQLFRLTQIKRK
jgi:hypothetical protein